MKRILSLVIAIVFILSLFSCGSINSYDDKAIASAESYVTSQFYDDWGYAAERLESTVIYAEEDTSGNPIHLIVVRCYWNSTVTGSYCVYTKLCTFRGSTKMLPAGYDFIENLDSLKAMFGIVG